MSEIETIKKIELIGYVGNLENKENLSLTENILLRQTTIKEKENFEKFNKNPELEGAIINHCFEFIFDDNFIDKIKNETTKPDDLKETVLFEAMYQLATIIEAINISKSQPCELIRIDINDHGNYIPEFNSGFFLDIRSRYFEDLNCVISEEDIETINIVFSKILKISESRDYKKDWIKVPLDYYNRYDESPLVADQIIDLIVGLEALLSGSGENTEISYRLRLRSSLYLYHIDKYAPRQVIKIVNEMYSLRSKIVHGSISLMDTEFSDIKYMPGLKLTPLAATRVLKNILRIMLLYTIINHLDKPKDDFIKFIDSIWFKDIKSSEFKILDDHEIVYSYKSSEK